MKKKNKVADICHYTYLYNMILNVGAIRDNYYLKPFTKKESTQAFKCVFIFAHKIK